VHDADVEGPRFEVMQVISRTPDCRVHDIAAGLSITVGGASKLVDRIGATGDCLRRANLPPRRDRRGAPALAGRRGAGKLVVLTP
jgi:DNA-binding MarR family transcriptional regulator